MMERAAEWRQRAALAVREKDPSTLPRLKRLVEVLAECLDEQKVLIAELTASSRDYSDFSKNLDRICERTDNGREDGKEELLGYLTEFDCREELQHLLRSDLLARRDREELWFVAARFGVEYVSAILCDFSFDKNTESCESGESQPQTALTRAVEDEDEESVRFLLSLGVDVNYQRERDATTALMVACEVKSIPVMQLLLDGGADVSICDKDGRTVMEYSMSDEMEEFLENYASTTASHYTLK